MTGPQPLHSDDRGFVLSIVIIIIGSLLSVAAVSTALASITDLEHATTLQDGFESRYEMETCIDDALLQIQRDLTWEGANYTIDAVTCNTIISGAGNSRTITIDANVDEKYYRSWVMDVRISPFAVNSIE